MAPVLRGLVDQLKRTFIARRFQVILALLVGLSCLCVEIYRQQVLRDLPVAVVDLDNSRLSRRMRLMLGSLREVQIVGEFVGSPDDAQRLLTEGRVAAVVVIPSSFSQDIKRGAKGVVLVGVDMSNILVGKNVHKAVGKAVGTMGAGIQLTTVQKLGARSESALPAVVPVVVDENFSFNPATNYSVYVVPGLLLFLLHVYTIVLATSVLLPEQGPEGLRAKLGAMIAILLVSFALGVGMFWVLVPWAGIQPASGPAALLVMLAALLVGDLLFASAVFSLVPSSLLAMELTIAMAMLSLMLSGITWPTDMFPSALQSLAAWIPFTPFAQGLRTLVHYATPLGDLGPWLGTLARQSCLYLLLLTSAVATRAGVAALRHRRFAW